MSDPAPAADAPAPMAADPVAPPAPKRELSPARADDASDAPAAKKAKSEAPSDDAADASEAALEPKPESKPRTAPRAMTEEEKLAAVAAKIKEQTERTAKAAAIAAQREADKMEAKIAAQLTKGQEDKLKKAMKGLASELTNVAKCVAAKEAAEVKAMGAGISPADLAAFVAARHGKSNKSVSAATASAPIKSTADILKEPACPDDRLPAHLVAYEGDTGDRHKLMAWKKDVEKFKDRVDRERDAYVAKRKKALKAEASKGAQALQKALAEVTKRLDLVEKANACVVRAQKELESVKERGEQLQETLALKAKLAREKLDAKNAVALAALDQKLARMEGRKLDEAKATVEREAAKEREKREAKEAREAQRKAEKACLLYTSPSPRDGLLSRMPSSA